MYYMPLGPRVYLPSLISETLVPSPPSPSVNVFNYSPSSIDYPVRLFCHTSTSSLQIDKNTRLLSNPYPYILSHMWNSVSIPITGSLHTLFLTPLKLLFVYLKGLFSPPSLIVLIGEQSVVKDIYNSIGNQPQLVD